MEGVYRNISEIKLSSGDPNNALWQRKIKNNNKSPSNDEANPC
jgi:hypothetical protein